MSRKDIIGQRRTANTVRRDGGRVISEVLWLDAARELVCGIEADIRTLAIQDAWLEVLKGTDTPVRRTFGFLAGAPAFIEGKKIIRQTLTGPEDTIPSYLLQQCINGIIQAETYFFRERGFSDEEGYNCYWDELETGGCRMYSHPDPADLRWMDYVPPGPRTRSLFHRLKSTRIMALPSRLICRGDFTDSYHEIVLQLTCDASTGRIQDADITYLRAPGKACFDNGLHASDLTGRNIFRMTGNEILDAAGRSEGCYHLVEMLKDICMSVNEYIPPTD